MKNHIWVIEVLDGEFPKLGWQPTAETRFRRKDAIGLSKMLACRNGRSNKDQFRVRKYEAVEK
jgi:hypothetical protein